MPNVDNSIAHTDDRVKDVDDGAQYVAHQSSKNI